MNCKLFKASEIEEINAFMEGKSIEKIEVLTWIGQSGGSYEGYTVNYAYPIYYVPDIVAVYWYPPYNEKLDTTDEDKEPSGIGSLF